MSSTRPPGSDLAVGVHQLSRFRRALGGDELVERLGETEVFLDSRSIPLGEDSSERLINEVRSSVVLLAVVGSGWYKYQPLDHRVDWVHLEIATALEANVRVIPVLLDAARQPRHDDLPDDIKGLADKQYRRIRRNNARDDVRRLIDDVLSVDERLSGGPKPSREAIEHWLQRILPAAQQVLGGRGSLVDVAWSLLQDDERPRYLAPCSHRRGLPGSAVLLVTSRRMYVADLDGDSRVKHSLPLALDNLVSIGFHRRRRAAIVAVADLTLSFADGASVPVVGLLRAQADEIVDILTNVVTRNTQRRRK